MTDSPKSLPPAGEGRDHRVPRLLRHAFTLLAITLALVACGWAAMRSGVDPGHLQARVRAAMPWFSAVHWALIAVLWFRWPALVAWGERRGYVKTDELGEALGSLKYKVIGFLVVFELLVVMGLPGSLWR